jgi:hypothetical protein
MDRKLNSHVAVSLACLILLAFSAGCRTDSYAEGGALFGGLTGAGVGALVGDSLGNAGAGAIVGAGVGALTGAAVGDSLDEIDARNRAQIAAQLGRNVRAGAATEAEVVAMSQAGVSDVLIINHLRNNGVAAVPDVEAILRLNSAGVSANVIQAMQAPPIPPVAVAPGPVIVEEHHYISPPYFYGPHRVHYHRRPRTGVSWGVTFAN